MVRKLIVADQKNFLHAIEGLVRVNHLVKATVHRLPFLDRPVLSP